MSVRAAAARIGRYTAVVSTVPICTARCRSPAFQRCTRVETRVTRSSRHRSAAVWSLPASVAPRRAWGCTGARSGDPCRRPLGIPASCCGGRPIGHQGGDMRPQPTQLPAGAERTCHGHVTPLRSWHTPHNGSGAAGRRPGRTAWRSHGGDSLRLGRLRHSRGLADGALREAVPAPRRFLAGRRPGDACSRPRSDPGWPDRKGRQALRSRGIGAVSFALSSDADRFHDPGHDAFASAGRPA